MFLFVRLFVVFPALFFAGFFLVMAVWDRYHFYREYKIAAAGIAHLDALSEGDAIPLNEYLKARAYHYARKVKDDVARLGEDMGEVDPARLRGIPISTGSVDHESDYEAFKKRFGE